MSTFFVGIIPDEHRSLILAWRTESTLVSRFFPYKAHVKASISLTIYLDTIQLSPKLEGGPENFSAFSITLSGLTFPIPLKQLVVSHPEYTCSDISVVQRSGPNSLASSPMFISLCLLPVPVSNNMLMPFN